MKDNRKLVIVALFISILALSIGFAAFSNTLTISQSASVNPSDENFKIQFSKVSDADQTGVNYQIIPDNETYGDRATIRNDDKKILEGVHAKFSAPGQRVEYNLFVRNAGSYKAYLNELSMGEKICSVVENQEHPEQEATESLKNEACKGISITVKIDDVTLTSSGSLNNMELDVNGYKPVQIVISYASGASYVDGPIEVSFGDIKISATSAPKSNSGQSGEQQIADDEDDTDDSCTITAIKSFEDNCRIVDNVGDQSITVGDKITCGTESFYVIEDLNDGSTVKMLSEWNLNVKEDGIDDTFNSPYSYRYCASTPGYQDEHVRGNVDVQHDSNLLPYTTPVSIDFNGQQIEINWPYGTVKFDKVTTGKKGYWTTGENADLNTDLYTECKENCSADNRQYPSDVYDSHATLKTFVDKYVGKLNESLSTNAKARLITLDEVNSLKDNYNWIFNTSYWTGTAKGSEAVWGVGSSGSIEYNTFDLGIYRGVRPVIEISSSKISS